MDIVVYSVIDVFALASLLGIVFLASVTGITLLADFCNYMAKKIRRRFNGH